MSRRVLRHNFVRSLAALVVTLLSQPAAGAPRDHLLRWIVPPDDDVAGYKVYFALRSMDYDEGVDIELRLPDSQGIAYYLYGGLESDSDYFVVMTAYDTEGFESVFSNEIVIEALACDPTGCDDGDPCTVDACWWRFCTNDRVPEGMDSDGDGVCDLVDNCLTRPNPMQVDSDEDGFGNMCDADYDNNAFVNYWDRFRLASAIVNAESEVASYDAVLDLNSDGRINRIDWLIFQSLYLGAPGPSGLGCAGNVPCAP